MTDVLREFVCKECGHKVVVHPKLPPDYVPTVCTPCWDKIVAPRNQRNEQRLFNEAFALIELLKEP